MDEKDSVETQTPLRRATHSLYNEIGPQKTRWCAGIAAAEHRGVILVFVKTERDLMKVPKEWEGFSVHAQVSGEFQLCGDEVQ